MQKRYCTCGAEVMVNYTARILGSGWNSRFFMGAGGRTRITECPCCKRKLAIDSLR